MNHKNEKFRSAKDRAREAEFCKHYRAIGIPAVNAATALKSKKSVDKSAEKTQQK